MNRRITNRFEKHHYCTEEREGANRVLKIQRDLDTIAAKVDQIQESCASCLERNCVRGWKHISCDRRRKKNEKRVKRDLNQIATRLGVIAQTDLRLCIK